MTSGPAGEVRGPAFWSACFGLLVGVARPTALYSVEIAQVVAGRIELPAGSPMAIHHGRVFSIVVDVAAVLLRLGMSEEWVCRVFTALMCAVAFAAVSVAAFAFTRNRRAAYVMPWLMFGYVWGANAHRYPISFPLGEADLGANGLMAALLALGLMALRAPAGVFLLGMFPGVHASWAAAIWFVAGVGACADREARAVFAQQWRYFVAGLALVVVMWTAHQWLAPAFSTGPATVDLRYVKAVMRYWDGHRAPLGVKGLRHWVSLLRADLVFLALAGVGCLSNFAKTRGVRFWLLGAVAMSLVALANSAADELAPGLLPVPVSAMMLSRWLNLNTFLVPTLAMALVGYLASGWLRAACEDARFGVLVCAIGVLPGVMAISPTSDWSRRSPWPADRPLLERVAKRPGVLISAADLTFQQLQTGRPQLLDLDLVDVLPYAPAASAGMESIMNEAYGMSLLSPAGRGQLDDLAARWAARPVTQWVELRHKYGASDVLVPATWPRLTLPMIETSDTLTLYWIPE